MQPPIFNTKTDLLQWTDDSVYVGRPMPSLLALKLPCLQNLPATSIKKLQTSFEPALSKKTVYANEFGHLPLPRCELIAKKHHALSLLLQSKNLTTLRPLFHNLHKRPLFCWCSPLPCHASLLAELGFLFEKYTSPTKEHVPAYWSKLIAEFAQPLSPTPLGTDTNPHRAYLLSQLNAQTSSKNASANQLPLF